MSDTSTVSSEELMDEAVPDNTPSDANTQLSGTGALVIQDTISRLQAGNTSVFSTVVGTDFSAKVSTLRAVTTAEPLAEHLGKHIDLENIVVQIVDIADRKTGEVSQAPRVILLDADGTAYYGISPVLLKAVETYVGVLGQPHEWPGPLGTKVLREKSNNGFYFYNMVLDDEKILKVKPSNKS